MANRGWRYLLADTETLEPIDEIGKASGRNLALDLGMAGSANFGVPLDDRVGSKIISLETSVLAVQDDDIEWSGFVWTIDDHAESNKREVNVVGWFEELNHRIVRGPYTDLAGTVIPTQQEAWTDVDANVPIRALLDKANAQRDDEGTLRPTHLTNGPFDLSQLRSRGVEPGQKIGEEMRKFQTIEAGVDLWVDPVTRQLHIIWDEIILGASIYGMGTDKRDDIVLGFNWGPNNLQEAGRQINPDRMVNRFTASSNFGLRRAEDRASMDQTGFMFEDQVNLPEAKTTDALAGYALAEVSVRGFPLPLINIRPFPWSEGYRSVPRPLKDYGLGDVVTATVLQGAFALEQYPIRIHGLNIDIPDDGATETVSSIKTTR